MSNKMWVIYSILTVGLAFVAIQHAHAGVVVPLILTLGGALISLVGAAIAALFPGPGTIIGTGALVVQVLCILAGVIIGLSRIDPALPPFLGPPLPSSTFEAGVPNFTNATYPLLPLMGGSADGFILAANDVVTDLNHLDADFRSGASPTTLVTDINRAGLAGSHVADQFDTLGINPGFSQADFDSLQAGIAASGLPTLESDYFRSAGLSTSDIDTFGRFLASVPIHLTVPMVSSSEVL